MELKKYSSFEELKAEDNNQPKASKEEIEKREKQLREFIKILRENIVLTKNKK